MSKQHNVADEAAIQKQAEEQRLLREQELNDIKALAATPQGLRFFKRLMKIGKVFSTTFTGNSQTFFLEGHRNFALLIFNDLAEAVPEKITAIMLNKEKDYE